MRQILIEVFDGNRIIFVPNKATDREIEEIVQNEINNSTEWSEVE